MVSMGTRKPLHLRAHSMQRALNREYYNQVTGPALDHLTRAAQGFSTDLTQVSIDELAGLYADLDMTSHEVLDHRE
jgi:hypothetical protein